jgi:RNA polymerase sigma-70 factor (ECF subfamily)
MKRLSDPALPENLPERLKNSEALAFEQFALYFGPRFRSFFLRKGLPPHEAEDLAANCIVDAALQVGKFRNVSGGSFQGWLFVIARHAAADWHRAKQRQPSARDVMLYIELNHEREAALADAEVILAVREAIAKLSDLQRQVIESRYFGDEASFGEIGNRLGIEEGAARVRHLRALHRLKQVLQLDPRISKRLSGAEASNSESNLEQTK